jgi:hypothetical protein
LFAERLFRATILLQIWGFILPKLPSHSLPSKHHIIDPSLIILHDKQHLLRGDIFSGTAHGFKSESSCVEMLIKTLFCSSKVIPRYIHNIP